MGGGRHNMSDMEWYVGNVLRVRRKAPGAGGALLPPGYCGPIADRPRAERHWE